ncbi:MAG: flagellar biosynthetic protein FliO [Deltaproteobacteria bacterium]|nr:flagellar biosynthetic protein FliO [Deltaproteobacteria bacterium]
MYQILFSILFVLAASDKQPIPENSLKTNINIATSENTKANSTQTLFDKNTPNIDLNAKEPPPSSYDISLSNTKSKEDKSHEDESHSLMSQIWRTLLSLAFVVALIYGLGKIVLWRLGRGKIRTQGILKIIERCPLDTRHTLFIIEVFGKYKYLIGAGNDKGITLLADINQKATENQGSFAKVFSQTERVEPDFAKPNDNNERP